MNAARPVNRQSPSGGRQPAWRYLQTRLLRWTPPIQRRSGDSSDFRVVLALARPVRFAAPAGGSGLQGRLGNWPPHVVTSDPPYESAESPSSHLRSPLAWDGRPIRACFAKPFRKTGGVALPVALSLEANRADRDRNETAQQDQSRRFHGWVFRADAICHGSAYDLAIGAGSNPAPRHFVSAGLGLTNPRGFRASAKITIFPRQE